jgi:DNA polymerase V
MSSREVYSLLTINFLQHEVVMQRQEFTILIPPERTVQHPIPFAISPIPAGFPSAMESFVERTLDLNDLLIKHPASTFFIRVLGDSMINAGIVSHDILIVDRSISPVHNKIAVVRVGDEFTVKRLKIEDNKLFLVPENPDYAVVELHDEIDYEIWGIVTAVIHKV